MAGSVRYARGRALYTGAIGRSAFVAWQSTPEGQATLDEAASRTRFGLFTRPRAARRLWRQLSAAARDRDTNVIVQSELDAYLGRLRDFTSGDLPRIVVSLHRLVVVPRLLINAATYGAISRRLRSARAFASLEGGEPMRDFFVNTIVDHLDRAIADTMPSPKRPLAVGRDWVSVGLDRAFVWRLPLLNEPTWDGHHYVLDVTREPMTRRVRKMVAAALTQIEASLAMLSRLERNEVLRRAAHGP